MRGILERKIGQAPVSRILASRVSTCCREIGVLIPPSQWSVGVLWSAVATMDETRHGLAVGQLEALEGLRAGDFVHQMAVDVEKRRPVVLLMDDVVLPKLVVKRLRHGSRQMAKSVELLHRIGGTFCPRKPGPEPSARSAPARTQKRSRG